MSMDIEERNRQLRALLGDSRLPAVLALIQDHEEAFVDGGCDQRLAGDGNKQSHALGSVYALRTLRRELVALVEAPPPEAVRRRRGRAGEGVERVEG